MFKHGAHPEKDGKQPDEDKILASQAAKGQSAPEASSSPEPITGYAGVRELKELLEKNLKWSQIIYEQNRKINHKLLLSAIASWVHVLIILVPIILGALLIPGLIRDYNCLTKNKGCTTQSKATWENITKYLPLDNTQRQELQNIVK